METIQDYLSKILNSRYGKEVRQAIHDAIHQCYSDGKAGSIDLEARDSIDALNSNLVYTGTINTGLPGGSTIEIITYVDNLLKSGTSINCEVTWESNSALVIGRKISAIRSRYIYMPRTNNSIYTLLKDSTGAFVINQVSVV